MSGRFHASCPCGSVMVISGPRTDEDDDDVRDWEIEHEACVAEPPTDPRLAEAVTALVEVQKILGDVFGDKPSEARAKVISAAHELAKLGNVRTCRVPWCTNKNPGHGEHHFSQTVTAKGGREHLDVGAAVDLNGDYDDEIAFRAWFAEDDDRDSVFVNLNVDQAFEVIALIELAIARRQELRGVK